MKGKGNGFRHPMNRTEAIVGWVYVFVHIFAMTFILSALNTRVFPALGFTLSDTWLNLVYYAVGFFFLLAFLFGFLKESFADLCGNFVNALVAILAGYVAYVVLTYIVGLVLSLFLSDLVNPNSAAVNSVTKLNPNKMLAISVLLAPVVEETLFRGVVFGTIRRKSAVAAYIVSTLLFAVYHLWQFMVISFSPTLLLYLLQYVPAGLVLGWCYERGKSVWAPVLLHMMINFVVIRVQIG